MSKRIEREWAGRTLAIETDKVAKQADGAVLIHYGETVVLVTAVAAREVKERMDFFPLLVNYIEMTYAAGRIPGGFFKREGRPTDREVLSSRLIDRGIRPLFPKGFLNETQVVATVLSADQQNDPSILGIIGASVALQQAQHRVRANDRRAGGKAAVAGGFDQVVPAIGECGAVADPAISAAAVGQNRVPDGRCG